MPLQGPSLGLKHFTAPSGGNVLGPAKPIEQPTKPNIVKDRCHWGGGFAAPTTASRRVASRAKPNPEPQTPSPQEMMNLWLWWNQTRKMAPGEDADHPLLDRHGGSVHPHGLSEALMWADTFHSIMLHCSTLQYMTLLAFNVHVAALHCIALHYITLHFLNSQNWRSRAF